jgi:response regulator RpfG family c-di-GMP phosphodiesterase
MIGLEESAGANDASDSAKMLEHVRLGAEVAREIPRRDVSEIVMYHHERFDGTGYLGLRGKQIPIGAQIVAFAEAVESIIRESSSSSSHGLNEVVIGKIREGAGKMFDPRVVDAFLEAAEGDPSLLLSVSDSQPSVLATQPESSN